MKAGGTAGRRCCLQITEELKCTRERFFFQKHRTVNSGFKRSNFLILPAIKKNDMNHVISSIFLFTTKSLN